MISKAKGRRCNNEGKPSLLAAGPFNLALRSFLASFARPLRLQSWPASERETAASRAQLGT